MFMNMLFQHLVEPRPTEPAADSAPHKVREEEQNYNHSDE